MKKSYLYLCVGAVLAVFSHWGLADNNAAKTVTIGGTVRASLTVLAVVQDLTLPDLVLPDSGETTTVTFTCTANGNGTVVYDNRGGNPFAHGVSNATAVNAASANSSVNGGAGNEAGACASLWIQGQANFYFVAVNSVANVSLGTGTTLNNLNCSVTNAGKLVGGVATVSCGGTLTADDTAVAGAYSGTVNVTVTYD